MRQAFGCHNGVILRKNDLTAVVNEFFGQYEYGTACSGDRKEAGEKTQSILGGCSLKLITDSKWRLRGHPCPDATGEPLTVKDLEDALFERGY